MSGRRRPRCCAGRLTGTLDGGAIATGVALRDVHWKSLDRNGTDIAVDRVSCRWELTREPLRFTIDYLHVGTIDARIAPSPKETAKTGLPKDLRLPLQLAIRDVTVGKLRLHQGATTTEFLRVSRFTGASDGRQHEGERRAPLETPFGSVTAAVKPSRRRAAVPAHRRRRPTLGKVSGEAVQVAAHLTGSLENLVADVQARRHEARRPRARRSAALCRRAVEERQRERRSRQSAGVQPERAVAPTSRYAPPK